MSDEPKKIFFSYGTVGLMGEPAYKAARQVLDDYYHTGPPEVLFAYEPMVARLRAEVAKLLRCGEDEVTYIKNTSEGINIAAAALPLERGDEVLLGANEYPANLLLWLRKKKEGIGVRIVEGNDNEKIFENMLASIGPRTKAVSLSWAQHYDGYLPDLGAFSDICRKRGIYLVMDAVQGIGVREIDLRKTPVDILVCGGQKYLGAIIGIGFMYVNRDTLPHLGDTALGIRSVQNFDTNSYILKGTTERFEDGTMNLLGIVALHAALEELNSIGIKQIVKTNDALMARFKAHLHERGVAFIDYPLQGNILALKVGNPVALGKYLMSKHIYTKPIKDILRVSFSHTSTFEDFAVLVQNIVEWREAQEQSTPVPHGSLAVIA